MHFETVGTLFSREAKVNRLVQTSGTALPNGENYTLVRRDGRVEKGSQLEFAAILDRSSPKDS